MVLNLSCLVTKNILIYLSLAIPSILFFSELTVELISIQSNIGSDKVKHNTPFKTKFRTFLWYDIVLIKRVLVLTGCIYILQR